MKFTPFQVFLIHMALKTHFTKSGYDFTESQGKLKNIPALRRSYTKRTDRYFFEKIAYEVRDPVRLIVATAAAQLPIRSFPTIVECSGPIGRVALVEWDRVTQSLKQEIINWLVSVDSQIESFEDIFQWNTKKSPLIFDAPRPIAAALIPAAPEEFELKAHIMAKPYIQLYKKLRPFLNAKGKDIESAVIAAIGPKYTVQFSASNSEIDGHHLTT